MRAVLDPNVLVSAVISPAGPPAQILQAWADEQFELIASPQLLNELDQVLRRRKFRRWISAQTASGYVEALAEATTVIDDPVPLARTVTDPGDEYLLALARAAPADYLVSGDAHLTGLASSDPPVLRPREFLDLLHASSRA